MKILLFGGLFDAWELPTFEQMLRGLTAWLCQAIYPIISWLYDLFINLTKVNILSNDTIKPIYQRLTLILTIIMVFYVTFEFVKYIVQPEMMTDKEKGAGKIVYKMIAVVLLIAFVPSVFTGAMKLQNAIINKGVIGKIILGQGAEVNSNYGGAFATQVLEVFYSVPDEYANELCDDIPCAALVGMNKTSLRDSGSLPYFTTGINSGKDIKIDSYGETHKVKTAFIKFDGLLAVIIGGFIAYILLLYCVDVGVRWAQLIYLQIIAPIPIIGFLSPKKDGIFQKWCKQCLTTYLDLFIRVSIIYFILLICSILLDSVENGNLFSNIQGVSGWMQSFIVIFLIMGVMLFAHKAPKMLKELFPSSGAASGNFGLKASDRGLNRLFGAAAGTAIGAGAGLATGFGQGLRRIKSVDPSAPWYKKAGAGIIGTSKGIVGGTIGGATRGLVNGTKKGNILKNATAGAKSQIKANERFGNREASGYGMLNQMEDRLRGTFGAPSREKVHEDRKSELTRQKDAYSLISKSNESIRDYAWKKAQSGKSDYYANYEAAEGRRNMYRDKTLQELGLNSEQEREVRIREAINAMKQWKDIATNDYIDNNITRDGALKNMMKDRDAKLEDYNNHVGDSYKVSDTVSFEYDKLNNDGTKTRVQVENKKISELSAQELDELNKLIVSDKEAELGREINREQTEIDRIKRQTAGSGINDGKK